MTRLTILDGARRTRRILLATATVACSILAALLQPAPLFAQLAVRVTAAQDEVISVSKIEQRFWLRTTDAVYVVEGNGVQPIQGINHAVKSIELVGDQVWISSSRGAYRISGTIAKRLPDRQLDVRRISQIGDAIWLATDSGAYRIRNDAAETILSGVEVVGIHKGRDAIWLGTRQGLYVLRPNTNQPVQIEPQRVYGLRAYQNDLWAETAQGIRRIRDDNIVWRSQAGMTIRQITEGGNNHHWLATTMGGYEVTDDQVVPLPNIDFEVDEVRSHATGSWMRTSRGAFRLRDDRQGVESVVASRAFEFISQGQSMWLRASDGAYRIRADSRVKFPASSVSVRSIAFVDGDAWLATDRGAYRVRGDVATRIPDQDLDVSFIRVLGKQVWLATSDGAWVVVEERSRTFANLAGGAKNIYAGVGGVWLVTDTAAYFVRAEPSSNAVQVPAAAFRIHSSAQIDGHVWLATTRGAFRLEDQGIIELTRIESSSVGLRWMQSFLPRNVWPSGPVRPIARYGRTDDASPFLEGVKPSFSYVMDVDESEFERSRREQSFSRDREVKLSPGMPTLHVAVRDAWGNEFAFHENGRAVPLDRYPMFILGGVLWIMAAAVAIALAPTLSLCHWLIMRPRLRALGSLGAVPLLLTLVPSLRRRLMRRCANNVARNYGDDVERFVPPGDQTAWTSVGERLRDRREVWIAGVMGSGKTAFLKYLAGSLAADRRCSPLGRDVVPIYLPLSSYANKDFATALIARLDDLQLTDADLARWTLHNVSMCFLIDDFHRASEETRGQVETFLRDNQTKHFVCLAVDDIPPRALNEQRLALEPLGEEQVRAAVKRHLRDATAEEAEDLLAKFTPGTFDVCGTPFDLVQILTTPALRENPPRDFREYVNGLLIAAVHGNKPMGIEKNLEAVAEKAFQMLGKKSVCFSEKDPVPAGMGEFLAIRGLIVRTSGANCFRNHDVLEVFAARHVSELPVDRLAAIDRFSPEFWAPAFEFIFRDAEPQRIRETIFFFLERERRLAARLFQWLQRERPDACESWRDEFIAEFGIRALKEEAD